MPGGLLLDALQRAGGRFGFLQRERTGQPLDLTQDFAAAEVAERIAGAGEALAPPRFHRHEELPPLARPQRDRVGGDAPAQIEQSAQISPAQHALIIPIVHPLDDPETYRILDPRGLAQLVIRFPEMADEIWQTAMRLKLPAADDATAIVVLGMGGSGVGGDLLLSLLAPTFPVPVVVVKDRRIPAFVGPQTLIFACSFSGGTEETLSAYAMAKDAGAPAVVITSGGALAAQAAAWGDPIVQLPPHLPQRAALPYLFLPMVSALRRLTHMSELSGEWAEAKTILAGLVEEVGPAARAERNPAKRLAARLAGHLPAVYASSPALAPAAYRWKCQFNENSKTLALWNTFPELNHNETVGWEDEALARQIAVVLLRDPDEEPAVARRVMATRDVAFGSAASVDEVRARGGTRLARLLSLVLFGDFVSVYLAMLRGVDPTPVARIDEIKRRLSANVQA